MFNNRSEPKVVHFFDCADVGRTLVKYGRAEGRPWWYRPQLPPGMRIGTAVPKFPTLATAKWRFNRTIEALRADMMHIHFGTRGGVANNRPVIPFVMHWHGTDIRTNYYDPKTRPNVQWGADHAARVVYATPDLREHAQRARPDAIYLPTAIDLSELPAWSPGDVPLVIFSSRWEDAKGGSNQLRLAQALRQALGPSIVMEGLDWGHLAGKAAELGVKLVPRKSKSEYLKWMSSAHCVVGQSAGILAVSELQAIAMGAPVVMRTTDGFYPGHPVLDGYDDDALISQVVRVLEDPSSASKGIAGRQWIETHHGPEAIVRQLAEIYQSVPLR